MRPARTLARTKARARRHWTALACAAALLAAALSAAGAHAQSLTDALVMAYGSNPALLAERAQLRAEDEGVAQALSGWRPTVTVGVNGGRQWYSSIPVAKAGSTPSNTEYPRAGSLTVTQNVYKGGKIEAQTRAADYNVLSERSHLQLVEQTTILNAALAYINVVEDQSLLDLNISNEKVLAEQLKATRDRFQVGEVTRTDVSQAEAQLSAAHAGRQAAESQLAIGRANYRNVIGVEPGQLIDPGEPVGLPGARDEALTLAQRQNPNVTMAVYSERSALANVERPAERAAAEPLDPGHPLQERAAGEPHRRHLGRPGPRGAVAARLHRGPRQLRGAPG